MFTVFYLYPVQQQQKKISKFTKLLSKGTEIRKFTKECIKIIVFLLKFYLTLDDPT